MTEQEERNKRFDENNYKHWGIGSVGAFDIKSFINSEVEIAEKNAIAEERKRIVEIIAETQKTTRLEQFTVDTILSLINKDN